MHLSKVVRDTGLLGFMDDTGLPFPPRPRHRHGRKMSPRTPAQIIAELRLEKGVEIKTPDGTVHVINKIDGNDVYVEKLRKCVNIFAIRLAFE